MAHLEDGNGALAYINAKKAVEKDPGNPLVNAILGACYRELRMAEQAQHVLGQTKNALQEIFRIDDKESDGVVTWNEFSGPKLTPLTPDYFAMLDLDRNERVTEEEFGADWHQVVVAKALSVDPSQIHFTLDEMFEDMDANRDGFLEKIEFQGQKRTRVEQLKDRKARAQQFAELFHRLDTNSDGLVSKQEYAVDWNTMPDGQSADRTFDLEDINQNGFIEFDEFGGTPLESNIM